MSMTKKQMAIHNRISTKCQAYVKYNHPELFKTFSNQCQLEYERGACRRNSYSDIQKALKPRNPGAGPVSDNFWGDTENSETYEELE